MALPTSSAKTRVKIMTVDPTTRRVEGVMKDGGMIQIAVWDVPNAFRWPQEGEIWFCHRQGTVWVLDNRQQESKDEETKALEDMNPGEMILDSDSIIDDRGYSVAVVDGSPFSGSTIVWDPSVDAYIPGSAIPGPLRITDGTHTETSVEIVLFDGATVSTTGPGEATVTIPAPPPSLEVTDGTHTETEIDTLLFVGAVVSSTGAGEATVTVEPEEADVTVANTFSGLVVGTETQVTFHTPGRAHQLYLVTANQACRIRLYATAADAAADISRNETTDPGQNTGLLLELVYPSALVMTLSPMPLLVNLDFIRSASFTGNVRADSSSILNVSLSGYVVAP